MTQRQVLIYKDTKKSIINYKDPLTILKTTKKQRQILKPQRPKDKS